MKATYQRVIPRDLFNEAKLLKCLGRLTLNIHNGGIPGLSFDHDGQPFEIDIYPYNALYVKNIQFFYKDVRIFFQTTYNSKSNYPLYLAFENCEYLVFEEDGNYSDEFIEILNTIA